MALSACLPRDEKIIKKRFAEVSFFLERKGERMPVYMLGNPSSKKILLVLHGGPGGNMNDYEHLKPLSVEFLLVGWEQRGNDFTKGNKPADIKLEDYADDLDFLIKEVKSRNEGKIFIYAGSFGAHIFWQYVKKYGDAAFEAVVFSMGVTYSPYETMLRNIARIRKEAGLRQKHLTPQHTPHWENLKNSIDSVQTAKIRSGDFFEFEAANQLCATAEKLLVSLYLEPRSISHNFVQSRYTTSYAVAKRKAELFRLNAEFWRRSDSTFWFLTPQWLLTDLKSTLNKCGKKMLFIHGENDIRISIEALENHIENLQPTPTLRVFPEHGHTITHIETETLRIFLREN